MNQIIKNIPYTTLQNLYGDENAVLEEFFPNQSFINFGFWPEDLNPTQMISIDQRLKSQKALYSYLLKKFEFLPDDSILEVGCGRGDGLVFLSNTFPHQKIAGIDIISEQIARAKKKIAFHNVDSIHLKQGAAEAIPFPSRSFSKIYSIEAAQHFSSLPLFAQECNRTLKEEGEVLIATFFCPDLLRKKLLKKLMPINIDTVDQVPILPDCIKAFEHEGFFLDYSETIGNRVFPGFDLWLSQRQTQDWARLWAQAWQKGLLDYYILHFKRLI